MSPFSRQGGARGGALLRSCVVNALALVAGAGLRRLAALVLILHVAGLAAPLAHSVAESAHEHSGTGGPAGSAVAASCDPGCTAPGHSHHRHDPAACAACRALGSVAVAPCSVVLAAATDASRSERVAAIVVVRAGCRLHPSSRGPPSLSVG